MGDKYIKLAKDKGTSLLKLTPMCANTPKSYHAFVSQVLVILYHDNFCKYEYPVWINQTTKP